MGITEKDLEDLLAASTAEHAVPGASCALLVDGQVVAAASGVANVRTGAPVGSDTRFLIGSVSKLFTTGLVLGLVNDGSIGLDDLVQDHVPELRLADDAALDAITVQHLLNHTSGIQGDHFEDFGRGDDAVARYVESMIELDLVHPVGAMFSYCNSGFVLAGRIVENVCGTPYRQALRERLLEPLGMDAALLPEEAILGPVAVGHSVTDDEEPQVVPSWLLPYGMGPAGSILCTTPTDLLSFARFHLDDGRIGSGEQVLGSGLLAQARKPHATIPNPARAMSMGLGWFLERAGDHRVLHHGGSTTGQVSKLWVLPDDGIALASVTNAAKGAYVNQDLANTLGRELIGEELAPLPPPARDDLDLELDRYVGTYARLRLEVDVRRNGDGLELVSRSEGMDGTDLNGSEPEPLLPIDEQYFRIGDGDRAGAIAFIAPDDTGRPGYLYAGRVARRVE